METETKAGLIDKGPGADYTLEEVLHNAQVDADAERRVMEVFQYRGRWQYAEKGARSTALAFGQMGYGPVERVVTPTSEPR